MPAPDGLTNGLDCRTTYGKSSYYFLNSKNILTKKISLLFAVFNVRLRDDFFVGIHCRHHCFSVMVIFIIVVVVLVTSITDTSNAANVVATTILIIGIGIGIIVITIFAIANILAAS